MILPGIGQALAAIIYVSSKFYLTYTLLDTSGYAPSLKGKYMECEKIAINHTYPDFSMKIK